MLDPIDRRVPTPPIPASVPGLRLWEVEDRYLIDKRIAPGADLDRHCHDDGSLTLVLEGRYEESFDDGETHFCPRLELQYKPPGIPHTTRAGPAGVRMFIVGVRGGAGPRGASSPALSRFPPGLATVVAARLWEGLAHGSLGADEALRGVDRLLALTAGSPAEPGPQARPWLRDVAELLDDRAVGLSGLAEVARRFRRHPVSLARAFHRAYGETVGERLHRRRVEASVERLARSDAPLSEIALAAGFYDQSHFTRVFRRLTGWTPGRFRRSLGGVPARLESS